MVLYSLKHPKHDLMNIALHQVPAGQLLCIILNGNCFLSSLRNILFHDVKMLLTFLNIIQFIFFLCIHRPIYGVIGNIFLIHTGVINSSGRRIYGVIYKDSANIYDIDYVANCTFYLGQSFIYYHGVIANKTILHIEKLLFQVNLLT